MKTILVTEIRRDKNHSDIWESCLKYENLHVVDLAGMFVCPMLKSLGLNVYFKLKGLLIAMLPFNAIVKKVFRVWLVLFGLELK